MKLVAFALCAAGCASAIPYTPSETCGLQHMKLQGVAVSSGTGIGQAQHWNPWTQQTTTSTAVVETSAQSVSCTLPAAPADLCDVRVDAAAVAPKADYNEGIKGKRLLNGLGYVLLIVPGVLLKLHYDSERDDAIAAGTAASSAMRQSCARR